MLKNISKDKRILLWVIVGFFFVMFDQNISLGGISPYPAYDTDPGYNLEFQVYSLNYTYGAGCDNMSELYSGDVYYQLTLDIIPDLAGFLILAVFLKKMEKFSRLFGIAALMSWFAVVMYGAVHIMPFIVNGMILSYMCFWMAIAMYGIEIIIGYVFVCGVCDTLSGYEHRASRKTIVIAWFGSIVLNAVVCVLRWIAVITPGLLVTYEIFQLGMNILFYFFIIRESDFIVKDKSLEE